VRKHCDEHVQTLTAQTQPTVPGRSLGSVHEAGSLRDSAADMTAGAPQSTSVPPPYKPHFTVQCRCPRGKSFSSRTNFQVLVLYLRPGVYSVVVLEESPCPQGPIFKSSSLELKSSSLSLSLKLDSLSLSSSLDIKSLSLSLSLKS